ncbi:TPA: hypothetical protein QCJ46_004748 [Enterobacter ludwigii]|jgi:uncharacterized protein YlzI (FlbEa/FlbD family)|uniref:hypothetical protein n=1 Tax=Enterobacter ludwigii TaxID=299767 RepID=UPI002FCFB1FD|nr:hypothetical protein [Enterobacter ludwigii]HDR2691707.1 hypothetical protein [Enterobacter ludwigii]
MNALPDNHRRWVANYCGGKIEELQYHLATIVKACDTSINLFSSNQQVPESNRQAVIYGFSSFTNVIQTLKDSIKTVTGKQLPWSTIKQLSHGAFFQDARNAATHDGNPVINAWVDGRYYVAHKIVRLGDKGQVIEISAPKNDVRTLCLEFSDDFCQLLRQRLLETKEDSSLEGTPFSLAELEEAFTNSDLMPDFAIKLFEKEKAIIAESIKVSKHDPVTQAIARLDTLMKYIKEHLQTSLRI